MTDIPYYSVFLKHLKNKTTYEYDIKVFNISCMHIGPEDMSLYTGLMTLSFVCVCVCVFVYMYRMQKFFLSLSHPAWKHTEPPSHLVPKTYVLQLVCGTGQSLTSCIWFGKGKVIHLPSCKLLFTLHFGKEDLCILLCE